MLFCETSNPFSKDLLLNGFDIFPQIMVIYLHLIKHVALGFNTFVHDCFYKQDFYKQRQAEIGKKSSKC